MKILSSFTHPNVIPNLYDFYVFSGTQNKTSQWSPKQISSIVFSRINKVMQVWNNMRVTELNYDRIFIFGWTIPLTAIVYWMIDLI